jgi:hypothetical protein
MKPKYILDFQKPLKYGTLAGFEIVSDTKPLTF